MDYYHYPKNNIFIGRRYIPKLADDGKGGCEWDNTLQTEYESLTIAMWQGCSYTSKCDVPKGVNITDENFWTKSADYNAQLAIYEGNVNDYKKQLDTDIININTSLNEFHSAMNDVIARNGILTINNLMGYKGINCRAYTKGTYDSTDYRNNLATLVSQCGFDSVSVVPNFYQTAKTSIDVGERCPISTTELTSFINYCKSLNLHVILTPHIECEATPYVWRATFAPINIPSWFSAYKSMMLEYAQVAESTGCEIFSIGSEMISLSGELYTSYWNDLISSIRDIFHGALTYGINCNSANTDEYDTIGSFVNNLDIISIDNYIDITPSFYYNGGKENVHALMYNIYERFNKKPVIIAEWYLNANPTISDTILQSYLSLPFIRGAFSWVLDPPDGDQTILNYSTAVKNVILSYYKTKFKPIENLDYHINDSEIQNYYDNDGAKYLKVGEISLNADYTGNIAVFRVVDCFNPNGYTFKDIVVSMQINTMNGTPQFGCQFLNDGGLETEIYAILTQNDSTLKKVELYFKTNQYSLYRYSLLYAESSQNVILSPRHFFYSSLPTGTISKGTNGILGNSEIGGDNLIKNGDFRDGTTSPWTLTTGGNFNVSNCLITVQDGTDIEALKQGQLTVQNINAGSDAQTIYTSPNIKVQANKSYVFSFDGKRNDAKNAKVKIDINYYTDTTLLSTDTFYTNSNTTYQKQKFNFVTPTNCNKIVIIITASLYNYSYAYAIGYYFITNIMLQKGNVATNYHHTA